MDYRKVQQRVLFIIATGFLLMAIRSIIERVPLLTIGLGLGSFAFLLVTALLFTFLKKQRLTGLYKAVCLVLCLLIIPVYYVICGGMEGGMIPFFLVGFYLISKTFYKMMRIILQSLTGILYTVVLLLSHYWWNQGVPMESEASVSAHIWHLIVASAIMIMIAAVYADFIKKTQEFLHQPAATEDKSVFGLPADIEDKLIHMSDDMTSALICFTVINGDRIKQAVGFQGYDAVLNDLKTFFLNLFEPGQTVVPYGGDSFVLLVESVTAEFAEEYARALSEEVRELKQEAGISVELKFGIHMTVPGESLETSLRQAERELF